MKYAVITPEKYAELRKEDKIESKPRFSKTIEKWYLGFFKQNYKNGMPFVTDTAADGIIITDTTETPDLRLSDTEQRVILSEEQVFKEMENGEVRYVKQIKGTIGDEVGAYGEIVPKSGISSQDVEEMMKEEIIKATAKKARERHFKELQDSTSVPFLMKLKKDGSTK